jgi:DNA-binding CsgD family transcriptional regulator
LGFFCPEQQCWGRENRNAHKIAGMPEAKLKRARECYRGHAWSEAHQLLSIADESCPLGAEDLELLAACAYLVGRDHDFHQALDRAHHSWLHQGEQCRAARCAFWIGLTLLFQGDEGRGNGWLARARRLVEGRDCIEQGYLLLPIAEQCLGDRQAEAALTAATGAGEIAGRFRDADLSACARHLQGRALIQQGQVERGLQLLDEAMVAVSGGEVSPIVTGLIYCSVIAACHGVFALVRAREWTSALSHWCEQQPQMVAFTGTCLLHRAEVMQFRGAWTEAMSEAYLARHRGYQAGEGKAPAAAFYRQGEIHRLRGEFAEAEEAYRHASRMGADPQPGLSLLRTAQGHTDAACAAIRRVLSATTDLLQRAKLLPAYVEIAKAACNIEQARSAAVELGEIARRYPTDVLRAMAAQARGAVELAEGRASSLASLREAFELWQRCEAPYEMACVRLLTALACRELGDGESADLEFDAARALFERLGAAPDLGRLVALRGRTDQARQFGLTKRELQILRQVSAGKTNKAIAKELSLSERTIDRHVSNLLSKLGVPSRAAATACAYGHKLI